MSLRLNLMKLTMPLQNNMVSNYAAQDNTTCEMSSFNDISQVVLCRMKYYYKYSIVDFVWNEDGGV